MGPNSIYERACTPYEGEALLRLADILIAQWRARAQVKAAAPPPRAATPKGQTLSAQRSADRMDEAKHTGKEKHGRP